MNNSIKLEEFYDPDKMRSCLFKMEQFFAISIDQSNDEKLRKASKLLFDHYRRLAICILTKKFNNDMKIDTVIDIETLKNALEDSKRFEKLCSIDGQEDQP